MATRAVRKVVQPWNVRKKTLSFWFWWRLRNSRKLNCIIHEFGISSHEISLGMCYHLMCLDDVWLDENRFMWEAPINDAMVARRLQNAAATLGHFIDQRELSKATQKNHFQTHSQKLTWRSLEKIPHFSIGNTSTHSCWRNSSDRHVSFSEGKNICFLGLVVEKKQSLIFQFPKKIWNPGADRYLRYWRIPGSSCSKYIGNWKMREWFHFHWFSENNHRKHTNPSPESSGPVSCHSIHNELFRGPTGPLHRLLVVI